MSEEQRNLAATYHFIIDETLKAMDLDYDEWYDVAAIGLCQAIADGIEDIQSVRESTINAVVGELVARDHSDDMYDSMEKADKIIV